MLNFMPIVYIGYENDNEIRSHLLWKRHLVEIFAENFEAHGVCPSERGNSFRHLANYAYYPENFMLNDGSRKIESLTLRLSSSLLCCCKTLRKHAHAIYRDF